MPKTTVLLIEDDCDMRKLLRLSLRDEGYRVLAAGTAERGLALFHREEPDLVVLDVVLPDMDGFDMCRVLRQESGVPVLFLTGRKSEFDKVLGLKLGADDYLTKPYSLKELLARLEVLQRRSKRQAAAKGTLLALGGVVLDPERRQVTVRGRRCDLPLKQFDLLRTLLESGGNVLSRAYLLRKVWGYAQAEELDTRTVDQHVARLRARLRNEGRLIETVAKAGYRIAPPNGKGAFSAGRGRPS